MNNSTRLILAILFLINSEFIYSQTKEIRPIYFINQKGDKKVDKAHFSIHDSLVSYKAGWVETKKVGDRTFQYTITKDSTEKIKTDTIVDLNFCWKAGEVKFTDETPGKLFINPWIFKNKSNPLLQRINSTSGYISVPNNGHITLTKTYFSVMPITIPFAIRFKRNDTIRSQASADLNLGVSLAFNVARVRFKNRRIKTQITSYGLSFGVAFGFSKVSLSDVNTSLDDSPLKNDENGLAFTIAPGIGVNINGFNIACFVGNDIALTSNVRKWNYYNRPYIGLGFGVNLSTIGQLIN